ncbi:MAG: disulfide bond formation protein B [Candidatus Levyibacteriota bacterium]
MQTQFAPLIALLGIGTLLFNIFSVVVIIIYASTVSTKKKHFLHELSKHLEKYSIELALVIAAAATIGSLFLSEIVKFPPCTLCWYQRIFMYPQVVVLGLGLYFNDRRAKIYALILSIIGLAIAIYHIGVQFLPGILPCSSETVSCSLKQFTYFGYVTIPVMSATAFIAIILVLLFGLRKKSR